MASDPSSKDAVALEDRMEERLAAQNADADNAYLAIGAYTVHFSVLVASMRRIWAGYIAGKDYGRRDLLELSFGGLGAATIAEAFFAMCKAIADFDEDEEAIWAKLRKNVLDETTERNNIAHGDWLIGHWVGDEKPIPPRLLRIKASSQKEPFKQRDVTAEELQQIANRVRNLAVAVWQLGCACTRPGEKRVRELLELTKAGRIVMPEGAVWIHPNPHEGL
jgi:hypothetical protein